MTHIEVCRHVVTMRKTEDKNLTVSVPQRKISRKNLPLNDQVNQCGWVGS